MTGLRMTRAAVEAARALAADNLALREALAEYIGWIMERDRLARLHYREFGSIHSGGMNEAFKESLAHTKKLRALLAEPDADGRK